MRRLFRKILVPHDFSDHATEALRTAADLAARHRGRLLVLNAVVPYSYVTGLPPVEGTVWLPPADLVGREQRRLEALVRRTLGRRRVKADCRVVVGDPYQRIVDAARKCDSIVMTTAGRSGLAHLLIGSVAEKVVRHSPVPVLTLRPSTSGARRRRRRRG
jgi:nucleotide-binding universal stress UspA family protein